MGFFLLRWLRVVLYVLIRVFSCATFVVLVGVLWCIVNIKDRITQGLVNSVAMDVLRINDNQYPGFHARFGTVKADGSRLISYYYFYRVGGRNGKQANYFIGNSAQMDAGVARRIAAKIYPHVSAGEDILQLKFAAEKQQIRLKDFWRFSAKDLFLIKYKNASDAVRNIEVNVLPQIGSVTLDKITNELVELRVFSPLIKAQKMSQLKVIASQLRGVLEHAVSNGYLRSQPIKRFKTIPPVKHVIQKVEVDLSAAQIKGIYYRAVKTTTHRAYLYTLRLQILTGQPLSTILASYRQDIKGNYWSLRATNGKLSGKIIPLQGPLKALFKEIISRFPLVNSLYLFPSKIARNGVDAAMDGRALAKAQQRFILDIHGQAIAMGSLIKQVELAMVRVNVPLLVVAYLFNRKVSDYLTLDPKDPLIALGLTQWYSGK